MAATKIVLTSELVKQMADDAKNSLIALAKLASAQAQLEQNKAPIGAFTEIKIISQKKWLVRDAATEHLFQAKFTSISQ